MAKGTIEQLTLALEQELVDVFQVKPVLQTQFADPLLVPVLLATTAQFLWQLNVSGFQTKLVMHMQLERLVEFCVKAYGMLLQLMVWLLVQFVPFQTRVLRQVHPPVGDGPNAPGIIAQFIALAGWQEVPAQLYPAIHEHDCGVVPYLPLVNWIRLQSSQHALLYQTKVFTQIQLPTLSFIPVELAIERQMLLDESPMHSIPFHMKPGLQTQDCVPFGVPTLFANLVQSTWQALPVQSYPVLQTQLAP